MTKNQISYWQNKETQRANYANERQKQQELAELQRHNLATEKLNKQIAKNNLRLGYYTAVETARSNRAREANQYTQIMYQDLASKRNYSSQRQQNLINSRAQIENERANKERERYNLSSLSNLAQYYGAQVAETQRHNMNTEAISRAQQDLSRRQLGETIRHNVRQEQIGSMQVGASVVSNLASSLIRATPGLIGGGKNAKTFKP